MHHLEVSFAVRPLKWSLGVIWLRYPSISRPTCGRHTVNGMTSVFRNIVQESGVS